MKKFMLFLAVAAALTVSVALADMPSGMQGMCGTCWMCSAGESFKAEKVKDGAVITLSSKENAAEIQEKAAKWVQWHKDMQAEMEKGGMQKMGGMQMDMRMCPFCVKGAVLAVENTKDGARLSITTKDAKTAGEIQDKAEKWAEMRSKTGMMGMMDEGMMMHGMNGMEMQGGIRMFAMRKMHMIFKFVIMIWSLLIILIIATIILVIKKIMMTSEGMAAGILKKRYAKGELTKEKFEEMKKDIK